jgi:DNA-binding MarR family transcriptional regulator
MISLSLTTPVALDAPDGGLAEAGSADASESELASRLRLAVTRLHRRLRQQTAGGLTPSQASALASIERLGSPTLGALAARESVQPPSMTRIVGALEELGYVSRVVDPDDRRVARVSATTEGHCVLQRGRSLKNAFLADQLHRLPDEDREALGALTALLERLVEGDDA